MDDPFIRQALRGSAVLVVHENRFQASYLHDVLRAAGAIVAGPVADGTQGIDLLVTMKAPAALVVSSSVPDSNVLFERAASHGWPTLLLHRSPAGARSDAPPGPCLATPYAGFQVVEALVQLIADQQSRRAATGRPSPRGH